MLFKNSCLIKVSVKVETNIQKWEHGVMIFFSVILFYFSQVIRN